MRIKRHKSKGVKEEYREYTQQKKLSSKLIWIWMEFTFMSLPDASYVLVTCRWCRFSLVKMVITPSH